MRSAFVDTNGRVQVYLTTSTNSGYNNQCEQYNDYGHFSVPLPNQIVNIEQQAQTNVVVTGFNNAITNSNFTAKNPGESTNYSTNWYHVRANSGVYVQPATGSYQTSKEHTTTGQTTNSVLLDIMNLMVELIAYLATHEHTVAGISTGTDSVISEVPTVIFPPSTLMTKDITNVEANANLAITDIYKPYANWV